MSIALYTGKFTGSNRKDSVVSVRVGICCKKLNKNNNKLEQGRRFADFSPGLCIC